MKLILLRLQNFYLSLPKRVTFVTDELFQGISFDVNNPVLISLNDDLLIIVTSQFPHYIGQSEMFICKI